MELQPISSGDLGNNGSRKHNLLQEIKVLIWKQFMNALSCISKFETFVSYSYGFATSWLVFQSRVFCWVYM
jgi:hypothetical protein